MADRPLIIVLFGATGDLAHRMVLPALFELYRKDLLPKQWALIGNGRSEKSDDEFRSTLVDTLRDAADSSEEKARAFADNAWFAGGGFTVDDPGDLVDKVDSVREHLGSDALLLHYIALPPSTFRDYTDALAKHELIEDARVVYEKPFGTSQKDFRELDEAVGKILDESQVFRVDHFLAKESTQNLHTARFANRLLGDVWNRESVSEVLIEAPETLDIDDRAEFYDATGAFLDMVTTHLIHVAAEVAMEPPISFSEEDLRDARESVLAAFGPLDPADTVFGQYAGYRSTEGIDDDSNTETYVSTRLWVDTDRWRDVPFRLRTGKMLDEDAQRVKLVLRAPDGPVKHLPETPGAITFDLSSGDVDLAVTVNKPGPSDELALAHAVLELDEVGDELSPYARLIHDVIEGDQSLFTRPDGLERVWEIADLVLSDPPEIVTYETGTAGPEDREDVQSQDAGTEES